MSSMKVTKVANDMKEEDYENLAIEDFGKTMLYKMGWQDNKGLGKDNKGPVNFIEFKARNHRLGLGAEPLVAYNDGNVEKKNYIGTKVKIIGGKHRELKGKIVDKNVAELFDTLDNYFKNNEYVDVELKVNGRVVRIETKYIKVKKHKERSRSRNKDDKKSEKDFKNKDSIHYQDNKKVSSNSNNNYLLHENKNKTKIKWLIPNILVRVINKESKYYNTKLAVEDILDEYNFSLIADDKSIIHNLSEKDLETVIPAEGEDVIIIKKEFKGERAKLISRHKKRNKVIVQLAFDLTLKEYTQDDICMIAN